MATNRRQRLAPRRTTHYAPRTLLRLQDGYDWDWLGGDPLSIAELKAVWQDVKSCWRDAVEALRDIGIHVPDGEVPWAALVFDEGLTPSEAIVRRMGRYASPTNDS